MVFVVSFEHFMTFRRTVVYDQSYLPVTLMLCENDYSCVRAYQRGGCGSSMVPVKRERQ